MPEFILPPLPYPNNALEPHIGARTMETHHDKHHQAYITAANTALKDHPDLIAMPVEELIAHLDKVPEVIRTAVRNNAGGHANHSQFWTVMKPGGGGEPTGPLSHAIATDLGGFAKFKEDFTKNGQTRFGSGWTWLVVKAGKLALLSTPNQDNPLMDGSGTPILGLDVWEHSYYLDYQNRRPDYLAAWWNTVNWDEVARRFAAAGA